MLWHLYVVLKLKFGVEVQEGLASPFQQKLGFTQMLHIFRVDTSNAYTYISFFFCATTTLFSSTITCITCSQGTHCVLHHIHDFLCPNHDIALRPIMLYENNECIRFMHCVFYQVHRNCIHCRPTVFWGGREGYQTLLNTDLRRELDHMGTFFKMVVQYKKKIGFTGQLLIEPKPKEPMKHQYDYGELLHASR